MGQAAAAREERAASISRAARAVSEVSAPRPTATSAWLSRREMQEQARAAAASSETEQKKVRIESTQQRSVQEQGSSTTIKKIGGLQLRMRFRGICQCQIKNCQNGKRKNGSRKGDIPQWIQINLPTKDRKERGRSEGKV